MGTMESRNGKSPSLQSYVMPLFRKPQSDVGRCKSGRNEEGKKECSAKWAGGKNTDSHLRIVNQEKNTTE